MSLGNRAMRTDEEERQLQESKRLREIHESLLHAFSRPGVQYTNLPLPDYRTAPTSETECTDITPVGLMAVRVLVSDEMRTRRTTTTTTNDPAPKSGKHRKDRTPQCTIPGLCYIENSIRKGAGGWCVHFMPIPELCCTGDDRDRCPHGLDCRSFVDPVWYRSPVYMGRTDQVSCGYTSAAFHNTRDGGIYQMFLDINTSEPGTQVRARISLVATKTETNVFGCSQGLTMVVENGPNGHNNTFSLAHPMSKRQITLKHESPQRPQQVTAIGPRMPLFMPLQAPLPPHGPSELPSPSPSNNEEDDLFSFSPPSPARLSGYSSLSSSTSDLDPSSSAMDTTEEALHPAPNNEGHPHMRSKLGIQGGANPLGVPLGVTDEKTGTRFYPSTGSNIMALEMSAVLFGDLDPSHSLSSRLGDFVVASMAQYGPGELMTTMPTFGRFGKAQETVAATEAMFMPKVDVIGLFVGADYRITKGQVGTAAEAGGWLSNEDHAHMVGATIPIRLVESVEQYFRMSEGGPASVVNPYEPIERVYCDGTVLVAQSRHTLRMQLRRTGKTHIIYDHGCHTVAVSGDLSDLGGATRSVTMPATRNGPGSGSKEHEVGATHLLMLDIDAKVSVVRADTTGSARPEHVFPISTKLEDMRATMWFSQDGRNVNRKVSRKLVPRTSQEVQNQTPQPNSNECGCSGCRSKEWWGAGQPMIARTYQGTFVIIGMPHGRPVTLSLR